MGVFLNAELYRLHVYCLNRTFKINSIMSFDKDFDGIAKRIS